MTSQPDPGTPDFNDLTEAEKRVVAERLLKIQKSGWKPFWCPDPTCSGDPHPLLDENGWEQFEPEDAVLGPAGQPLSQDVYEDEDGNLLGRMVLDPQWAHNHSRVDQRLLPWSRPWTLAMLSGRGGGKALALTTPIPTPSGWTTMGDIEVGDKVFDQDGRECRVTFTTPVQHKRECYDVHFSDGSVIRADAEHRWVTSTHQQRKQGYRHGVEPEQSVRTTAEILETLRFGKRGDLNHCVWVAGALKTRKARLPIDPYVLGAWLGDGSSAAAQLTVHDDDKDEMEKWVGPLGQPHRNEGAVCATYAMGVAEKVRDPQTGRMMANGSLHSRLREENLLGNKHIPAKYLRASEEQRLALLQGLMDTDGYAQETKGSVEFISTKRHLAEQVAELARSLGQKAVVAEGVATLNGREIGPKYRVTWRATRQVFRLKRKASRLCFHSAQIERSKHRMITAIEPVESEPVRCISVDSPSHTYLAGEQMIPTHNTEVGAHFIHLCHRKGVDTAILGRRGTELVNTHVKRILETAHPDFMPVHWASKDILEWPNGTTTYLFSAEKPENIRSVNVGAAWVDEGAHMPEIDTAWSNLKLATRIETPGNPIHILVTSTPTPTKWVMELEDDPEVEVRRVSTYANRANLSADFLKEMERKYEGTRLGRQELHGEVLRDVEGALWNEDMHQHLQIELGNWGRFLETLDDRVVAVDPAGSKGPRSDATGITAMGREDGVRLKAGNTNQYYVLAAVEKKGSPNEWAEEVFKVARHVRANRIVVERNFGGDMVKQTLSDYAALNPDTTCNEDGVPFRIVEERAVKSKETRAEPLVGAYEQERVTHVTRKHKYGDMSALEKEQLGWVPKSRGGKSPSPNLIDAEVWCFTNLHKGVRHKAVTASQKDIRKLIKRRRAA